MTTKSDTRPGAGYIRRADAKRILAENAARVAAIERELIDRILTRVARGESSQTATTEEVQRALAQLRAASATLEEAMAALPSYLKP